MGYGKRKHPEVEIYTLSSGDCRNISYSAMNLQRKILPRSPQAYINAAVHWIGEDINEYRYIVLFDMGSEVFHSIELPGTVPNIFPKFSELSLKPAVIEGSLSLVIV